MAMDAKTALDLLPELRSNGLLKHLSPPRDPVTNIVKKGTNPQVTLPTGEEVGGERPSYVAPSLTPAWFHVINKVVVELVIGSDGIARQPLHLAGHNDPLQVFVTLAFMRQWHFSPARVAGQPTTSTYVIVLKAQGAQ
jgi:hypothetical protein